MQIACKLRVVHHGDMGFLCKQIGCCIGSRGLKVWTKINGGRDAHNISVCFFEDKVTMLFSLRTLPDHKVDDIGLPVVEVFLDVSGITYDQYEYQLIPDFGWLLPIFLIISHGWESPIRKSTASALHSAPLEVVLTFGKSSNKQGYDHQIRGCDIET